MALIIGNTATVLHAYAALLGTAPSSPDLAWHLNYMKDKTVDGWINDVNAYFAGYSNEKMAEVVLKNLGLDTIDLEGDGNTDNMKVAIDFMNQNATNRVKAVIDLAQALTTLTNDPGVASVAHTYNNKLQDSYAHATNPASLAEKALNNTTFTLTGARDFFKGTMGNDHFDGRYNTLSDGDVLDGGSGTDTLFADVYAQNAITVETKGIESVLMRSQYKAGDNMADNNPKFSQVDAERMKGVLNWESNNSRADLVVEDVRIENDQITKDITVTMRETDSGNVDMGVYFDQYSLRSVTNNTSKINLQILDTRSLAEGKEDLLGNQNWGLKSFNFYASADGGKTFHYISLGNDKVTAARTVADMAVALQEAADARFGAGTVSVKLGSEYTVSDSKYGTKVTAREITISTKNAIMFDATDAHATTPDTKSGWRVSGLSSDSGIHANWNQDSTTSSDLVTAQVVLDDVGRGSTGGDLVIGGMSTGLTSESRGVEKFDITVEDDSTLRTISSTNDSLLEVSIKNGKTGRAAGAYNPVEKDAGKLVVKGEMGQKDYASGRNATLEGGSQSEFGFQNLRVIDGSAMTGKLDFNAELTENVQKKFMEAYTHRFQDMMRDWQADPTAEDAAIHYAGGKNDDSMWVNVDQSNAASNSNFRAGRADFKFIFDGNDGNDKLNVAIEREMKDPSVMGPQDFGVDKFNTDMTGFDAITSAAGDIAGNTAAWYANQRSNGKANFTLSGGAGNDEIRKPGAGDTTLDGGSGSDVIYADNTGAGVYEFDHDDDGGTVTPNLNVASKAVFVFGTTNNTAAAEAKANNLFDLKSVHSQTKASWGMEVEVGFRGLKSAKIAVDDLKDYKASYLDINQAIKNAINTDAVLSKLLVAEDGPSNALVVRSKIDGAMAVGDLTVNFTAKSLAAEAPETQTRVLEAVNKANGTSFANATAFDTHMTTNVLAKGTAGTLAEAYNTKFAEDDAAVANQMTGAVSIATSDNIIKPGVDNDLDVVVLGTTNDGTGELGSSNDIVRFEGAWGNDVVVNFDSAAGHGADKFDFTAVGGKGSLLQAYKAAIVNSEAVVDGHIERVVFTDTGSDTNNTAEAVKKLYAAGDAGTRAEVATELYLAVDAANNTAHAYKVVDGVAANDVTVEALGVLTVGTAAGAAIDWTTLTGTSFVG